MKHNSLQQVNLVGFFGSQPVVSELLNSNRQITIKQVKVLTLGFGMRVEAFI